MSIWIGRDCLRRFRRFTGIPENMSVTDITSSDGVQDLRLRADKRISCHHSCCGGRLPGGCVWQSATRAIWSQKMVPIAIRLIADAPITCRIKKGQVIDMTIWPPSGNAPAICEIRCGKQKMRLEVYLSFFTFN